MASFGASALGRSPGKISVSPTKRREMDVMKLMMSDHEVTTNSDDNVTEFWVKFNGPKETPYEGGVWQVHVELPDQYPYKSPSIGFANRIYHPNVDEVSGSVCLDVINQTWSPMYELINVFETFLPQLLGYPNPGDPMNGEAAALLMDDPESYAKKVREYVQRFARPEDARVPRSRPVEEEEDTPMPDAHGDSDVEDLEL